MTDQTPLRLKSYICGEWKAGSRDGQLLRDAGEAALVIGSIAPRADGDAATLVV